VKSEDPTPITPVQGYVESLKKHGEPIPAPITEAVVEVSV
jgi:hypothetical protein